MIKKILEKEKAIELRKKGRSYSEILAVIPVAKSTLALWLHDVGLAKVQKQRLTEKKILSAKRGALARKTQRLSSSRGIFSKAEAEIGRLSKREIFLIGIALYWAEGSKQKEHNVSHPLVFGNSDPNMIKFFLCWLDGLNIPRKDRVHQLYIHTTGNVERAVKFWASVVGEPASIFDGRVYYKKGNPKTKRKNTGDTYYGLLRITVKRSTDMNRKVSGWIKGIVKNL